MVYFITDQVYIWKSQTSDLRNRVSTFENYATLTDSILNLNKNKIEI